VLATYDAVPPIEATALVVDLRNFTPNLNSAPCDDDGVNVFCRFLAQFKALCIDMSLKALSPAQRDGPPVYISSTGDGAIVVFFDAERHATHGYLAALLMHHALERVCRTYNTELRKAEVPPTWFGLGLESGQVWRVRASTQNAARMPLVDTFIGNCINVASRAQDVTKTLHGAHTIIGERANVLLCSDLFGADYPALVARSLDASRTDHDRLGAQSEMAEFNRSLCVSFIHLHKLRGVEAPLALYRVSESAIRAGNPRFDRLLPLLARGDAAHLEELRAVLGEPSRSTTTT
jgi:class 3 adenylate cyclase